MKRLYIGIAWVFLSLMMSAVGYAGQLSSFRLGCGDVLEIAVWGDESLTRKVVVRPDGNISFPLVGDIKAAGNTVEQLRTECANRIKEYVPNAPVTVMLQELGSAKIFIVGKVNRPGMYLMDGPYTVLQALALAGGMTPYAEEDAIQVVRVSDSGEQKYVAFDYVEAVSGKSLEKNITLMPGDTVLVP
ncbi:polysaccharide export protein [Desulfovibrio mangrovi]|uniref:polysaccharide biosynthesis/export family protein n=1 Tax=Desulfovibrio mangrovi TaxID=2976983 RepID=UPI002246AE00|nr:polysaccharide biosynthesis/export family protein [Desulfovibrio mangrovi]UZP67594.1 polysaccharide export protein [Desulfovibrio mangrovi]